MKILINPEQLELLASNFRLVEGHGLVPHESQIISESRLKDYLVKIMVGAYVGQIRIGAYSGLNAMILCRKLFPKARVLGTYISV